MKTRKDVALLMESVFEQLRQTREAGQKEYAHSEENALRNFEDTGKELDIPRERVLWIFLKKHLDGVLAYIKGYQSQREDVRGRIKDIIVYLILLWAMIDDREGQRDKERQAIREQGTRPEDQLNYERRENEAPQGRGEGTQVGSDPQVGPRPGPLHIG